MKAIILAGGNGKRLRPLTELIPKPLLPIQGEPVLGSLLKNLSAVGIREVGVVVHHLETSIRKFLETNTPQGLDVKVFRQEKPLGSGDAVCAAASMIDDDILVVGGDTLFEKIHFQEVIRAHREKQAAGVLCLKELPPEILARASSVEMDSEGRIIRFVEKPPMGTAPSSYGAALLHLYPVALRDYLKRLTPSPRGELELTEVINWMIEDGLKVIGVPGPVPPDLTDFKDLMQLNFGYTQKLLES